MIVYEVSLNTYDGYLPNEKTTIKSLNFKVAPSTERFGEQWGCFYAKTYEEARAYAIDLLKKEKTYMEDYIERAKFRMGQCDKLINQLSNE